MDRRDFLGRVSAGIAAGLAAGVLPATCRAPAPLPPPEQRKLLVVLFGGGTRSQDTIDDPRHRFIPHLWRRLVPRGALFTNMRVEGKVVHPNSAGSIVTGHWEWDDLDWTRPVAHPTFFEVWRRARRRGPTSAWAFVYASILARLGYSSAVGHGARYGANVVVPPTIPRATAAEMDHLLRRAAATGSGEAELVAARRCAALARERSHIDLGGLLTDSTRAFAAGEYAGWRGGAGTTSHDAFLTDHAVACMRRFAPEVILVAFGEIDCAHYGSWSRYVEAIARTDALVARLWDTVRTLPAYRDRTLMLVLPDHGRELERPGGAGFIHHSDFYAGRGADEGCRRVWMLALGPGVRPGERRSEATPITAAAATGLHFLGLRASPGAEPSVLRDVVGVRTRARAA